MKAKVYVSFLILIGYFISCVEIPINLSDPILPESDRIILIEELTGASCPNCPKGSAAVESIINKFPGKVISVAIHGDFLSQPTAKSKFDFRNKKAKDLENWFHPWFGKPSASINRVPDDNGLLMIDVPELWQAAVEKELQKSHQLNLLLKSTFNATSRKFDLDIALIPLIDLIGIFNISVYLVESDIIDGQSNGSVIIENYKHNHVLREMLTRHDGDPISTDLKKNTIINRNYSYSLPSLPVGLWKPENMKAVVMVSRNEANNKSVIQSSEIKLK